MQKLSIIVPVYNEGQQAAEVLSNLIKQQLADEIILVDASTDMASISVIDELVAYYFDFQDVHILRLKKPGRAAQMNVGAQKASGDVLLFLHADTILPKNSDKAVLHALNNEHPWGRFKVKLDDDKPVFRLIAYMINLRSKLRKIATGDQAIFMTRDVFSKIGGYANIALMEDIEISRRLAKMADPILLDEYVITSARRWKNHGVLKTILLMWSLRFLYWLRVPPAWLARLYRYG